MASQDGPKTCVACRVRPVDPDWKPFCSRRCKIQDLARWADGSYSVPGEQVNDGDEPASAEPRKPH